MLQLTSRTTPGKPSSEGPGLLLLACHERIRRFCALATALADSAAVEPRELADAAAQVHRYFSVALPLHVTDEERTIRDALLVVHPTAPVGRALDTMAREHSEHSVFLADLIPCWAALAVEPRRVGELRVRLAAARHLDGLIREHLALEESEILPAVATLPEPVARSVLAEMRARRAPVAPSA